MRLERFVAAPVREVFLNTGTAGEPGYTRSTRVDKLRFDWDGIQGDRHYGRWAEAGGRVKILHTAGQGFTNYRHCLVVSTGDIAHLRGKLDHDVTAEDLGANVLLEEDSGLLQRLRVGSSIIFSPHTGGRSGRPEDVVLTVAAQGGPCRIAGADIAARYDDPALTAGFVAAALGEDQLTGYRGVVCQVARAGEPGNFDGVLVEPGYTAHIRPRKESRLD